VVFCVVVKGVEVVDWETEVVDVEVDDVDIDEVNGGVVEEVDPTVVVEVEFPTQPKISGLSFGSSGFQRPKSLQIATA